MPRTLFFPEEMLRNTAGDLVFRLGLFLKGAPEPFGELTENQKQDVERLAASVSREAIEKLDDILERNCRTIYELTNDPAIPS